MANLLRKNKTSQLKSMGDHDEFLNRITKSLYYARLPATDCLSLPVTELAAEFFSDIRGDSLERLYIEEASEISRNACISPCSLVLALLYLERLKDCNTEYLKRVAPSELFLVSLMVASKFLHDEGEEDEVLNLEWALSAKMTLERVNAIEKEFLKAINWSIYVHGEDFWGRLEKLEQDIAYKEAEKRGWFSYTELSCLMNSVQLVAIAITVLNVSSVCLATYTAGVATLIGSAIVASHLPGALILQNQSPGRLNNLTETKLTPIMEMQSTEIESGNRNYELGSKYWSLKCNKTFMVDKNIDIDTENESWKWWENWLMIWLSQDSNSNSENYHVTDETRFKQSNQFSFTTDIFTKNNLKIYHNRKKFFAINYEFPIQDWNYYFTTLVKISFGQWR